MLTRIIRNAQVFSGDSFSKADILITGGIISKIAPDLPLVSGSEEFNMDSCFVFPGLIDVHVHLREPGFSYKETIKTGTLAAARGGYTTICAMPNLDPVPDSLDNLSRELSLIARDACVRVLPYGSITVGEKQRELSDMEAMSCAAVAFSDDGTGVNDCELMENAMLLAKACGKTIVSHCEDKFYPCGPVNGGAAAERLGLPGNDPQSEWRPLERDIALVRRTGCRYHACHLSCAESVELVRRAKAEGLPVTCETAPHYLVLCDEDIKDCGSFRMNPPLRSAADREALIRGVADGTIDLIATDHAPHSAAEKNGGFAKSLNGVVGLETAFPVLYTKLVLTGIISLEKLLSLMSMDPSRVFGIGSPLAEGQRADLTAFDLNMHYTVDSDSFLSMGRSTPFEGMEVCGKCVLTMVGGKTVWEEKN